MNQGVSMKILDGHVGCAFISCEAKLLDPGDPLPPNRRAELKQAIGWVSIPVLEEDWYSLGAASSECKM